MHPMSSNFDSIFINGESLRPAPFVSTSYEYNTSGPYVIGGFLIVNLSGTIVGEDIAAQINSISQYQTNSNCVSIIIGCSGSSDFLEGSGRIRSVTVSPGDQPFTASYSMQIAVESIGGAPAVTPDTEFLTRTCLSSSDAQFLMNYTETLEVSGEGSTISNVDNTLQISKSYIKASGRISLACFTKEVCGIPTYNGQETLVNVIKSRAQSLMSMNICVQGSPLAQFAGWNKWLDTKSLTINGDGSADWSFDLYMSKGSAKPFAWIDVTTSDRQNHKEKTQNYNISGNIRGLSSASIDDYLSNKVDTNERITNAQSAFSALSSSISNGSWPSDGVTLTASACNTPPPDQSDPCEEDQEEQYCKQRISCSTKISPVSGEISFSAEFGSINTCNPSANGNIDFSVEEQLSVARHYEYIIPGYGDSVVVDLNAPTPHTLTITARGQLNSCDKTKLPQLISCVEALFAEQLSKTPGVWVLVTKSKTIGSVSYSITQEFIECDG